MHHTVCPVLYSFGFIRVCLQGHCLPQLLLSAILLFADCADNVVTYITRVGLLGEYYLKLILLFTYLIHVLLLHYSVYIAESSVPVD